MTRETLAIAALALVLACGAIAAGAEPARPVKNVVVFKESGRFGGWPANNGIWSWGNVIVVGFIEGYFKNVLFGHAIDDKKPSVVRLARSLDGGETWQIEVPSFLDAQDREREPTDCPGGLDFARPDSAVALRMISSSEGFSRFYYSPDRCRAWQGPYKLPTYDRKGIAARTDYLVMGPNDLMAFMTASKVDGDEGRVFCARTTDGGKTWPFVSWIGPEPPVGYSIMPSTVRTGPTSFLTVLRCKGRSLGWLEAYASEDDGQTWRFLNKPAEDMGSNPPSMIRLADGRIALTYGYRNAPYGIRAKISADNGRSWGDEIILRQDAGCWDLGYPRTVQRPDGLVVTIYYFNDAKDKERYIAATLWAPGKP